MKPSGTMRWFLFAAIAVGILLRLYGLGVHSLWLDEGFTVYIATAESIPDALRHGSHPPLSFYPYRLVFALTDPADWQLRLVPALLSCLSLLLFARIAAECMENTKARAAAVALYAVSSFLIWYAHEVRMYAFLELAGLLTLLSVLRLPKNPGLACLLGFVGTALGFGSQYLGIMPGLGSLAIAGFAVWDGKVSLRRALLYCASVIAGALVWVPWLIFYLPDQLAAGWAPLADSWVMGMLSLPVRFFLAQLRFLPASLVYTTAAIVGIGILSLLVDLTRRARARQVDWRMIALVIAFAAPLIGTLAVSLAVQPRFQPRYLIAAGGPFILLLCTSAGRMVPARAGLALASVLVAICITSNFLLHSHNLKDGYRQASAHIAANLEPGDSVAVCTMMRDGFSEAPVRFYLGPEAISVPLTNISSEADFGEWLRLHPGRVHLVARWMEYSAPLIESLLSETRELDRGEIIEDVQWILVTGDR